VGTVFERFTDRARETLVMAQEEARLLHHGFIGSEHILLGLLRQEDSVAGEVLASFGVTIEAGRRVVESILGDGSAEIELGSPPFTPRAKKILELSLRESLQLNHNYIGTEHLLLGLIREGEGVGAQILKELKVDLGEARQRVLQFIAGKADNEPSAATGKSSGGPQMSRTATLRSAPRCPQCRSELADKARYRTLEVRSEAQDAARDPATVTVVYCSVCGISLHMFTA
jgi:ATP-dependent Clp protease ATP-binding subunit ClpC